MPETLSVIIPAFNEERHLGQLLDKIVNLNMRQIGFELELIVVDDGSTDQTATIAKSFPGVIVISKSNGGKGSAVRTGITVCRGDWVLIQDGDLEYDPNDYADMLKAIHSERMSIYGSRSLGQLKARGWHLFPGRHPKQAFGPWLAGIILSLWTALLYGRWISDLLTAYKIYPGDFIRSCQLITQGFETDHEITARLIRSGYSIREVPISYEPRTVAEGKKIRAVDGIIACWTLLRFRFISLTRRIPSN